MRLYRAVLGTLLGVLSLTAIATSMDVRSYSDPRPICDPADPRCKPPIEP